MSEVNHEFILIWSEKYSFSPWPYLELNFPKSPNNSSTQYLPTLSKCLPTTKPREFHTKREQASRMNT